MGAFVLVFHRDGAPADIALVERLLGTLSHRGPDGASSLTSGPFGLGSQAFWTSPEEAGERQPVRDSSGRFLLLFDGRLDNREELLDALDVPPLERAALSDSAVVLRGGVSWGQGVWGRLVGPFAACLVDTLEQRVSLARDHLGERALVYHASPRLLVAASEEAALLAYPGLSATLDETSVVRLFAIRTPRAGSTMFAEIKEVLPAEVLAVGSNAEKHSVFWEPDQGPRFGRPEREWTDEFRHLLALSVQARLRSTTPAAALLSGGLDSGSVVALAATELARRGCPPPRTISWVFDGLPECDERRWIVPVVRSFGCDSLLFSGDGYWPLSESSCWQGTAAQPELNPYRALKQRAYLEAAIRGHRVLLVGASGDLLYSRWQPAFAHLLREGRLATLAREVAHSWRTWGLRGLRHHGSVRYLGRVLRDGLLLRREGVRPHSPSWLTGSAAARLVDSLMQDTSEPRSRDDCHSAVAFATAWGTSREVPHGERAGLDLRDPFRDHRLVELILRMPASMMLRRGQLKHVVRAAMKGLLPDSSRLRSFPTPLTPLYRRGLADKARQTAASHLAKAGHALGAFVQMDAVQRVLSEELTAGRSDSRALLPWYCIAMGLWYGIEGFGGLCE